MISTVNKEIPTRESIINDDMTNTAWIHAHAYICTRQKTCQIDGVHVRFGSRDRKFAILSRKRATL